MTDKKSKNEPPQEDFRQIKPSELPYLDPTALRGRDVILYPFHDGSRWHLWFPIENGFMVPMRPVDIVESVYLAPRSVQEDDAYISFLDFVLQHAETRKTKAFSDAYISDIFNLAASLRKFDILAKHPDRDGKLRWAATELEYLFVLCRRIYDLLQEIIARTWQTVTLHDTTTQKKELPKSFAKMVLHNKKPLSTEQIQNKFNIPKFLAHWYADQTDFFSKLRDARDAVTHHPATIPHIYADEAFRVDATQPPFSVLMEWPPEILTKNKIGPLNLFIAHCVYKTLAACEAFVPAITKQIEFPPSFCPGYKFYLRSPNMSALKGVGRVLDGDYEGGFALKKG